MNTVNDGSPTKVIVKKCTFCNKTFDAKRISAIYCSNNCKVKFNNARNKFRAGYYNDPNKGKTLPPGTVTSWEMPEDKLTFQGNKASLYIKLSEKVSAEQLIEEIEFVEKLEPFSKSKDWFKSSVQIFTDDYFMEVLMASPTEYKFYVWQWENGIPFE